MRKVGSILLLFGLALLCCFRANGASTGMVVGTVTDPTGAVIAGAMVTLANSTAGYDERVSSDQEGQYRNVVLFREITPHDSAPICRPLPWSSQNPASATSGPFDVGRVTLRPLDEDTQYGIRQFSARSRNQKHKS